MLISEFSKKIGLSKDTIRFYEKIGLITVNPKQTGTRIYKEYDQETMDRLLVIKRAKELGFTLNEIKEWLDKGGHSGTSNSEKIQSIAQKLKQLDEKIQQLSAARNFLVNKLDILKKDTL